MIACNATDILAVGRRLITVMPFVEDRTLCSYLYLMTYMQFSAFLQKQRAQRIQNHIFIMWTGRYLPLLMSISLHAVVYWLKKVTMVL